MRVEDNILSLIGGTPLIRLKKVVKGFDGNFFTKFEAFNPGHSNKDRYKYWKCSGFKQSNE